MGGKMRAKAAAITAKRNEGFRSRREGPCALCGRARVSDKHFCWGCDAYVCASCDVADTNGKHLPGDHRAARSDG